jgi:hypothetical protein
MRNRIAKNAEPNGRIDVAGYLTPLPEISDCVALGGLLLFHRVSIEGFCIRGKVGATRYAWVAKLWGAQAASLFFSAACRKALRVISIARKDVVGKLPTTAG